MRKSRVRLGPHLMAQMQANPHASTATFFKIVGTVLAVAIIFFIVKNRAGAPGPQPALPQDEAILGSQAVDTQNEDYYLYEIGPSETIFSISERFQINWDTIVELNNLTAPFSVVPGQVLKLPATSVTRQQRFNENLKKKIYLVEPGDTFVGIAGKLNISVTDLLRANPDLSAPELIRVGQTLKLP